MYSVMMSFVEPFIRKHIKQAPEQVGTERMALVDVSLLIATRRGLNAKRPLGRRRRGSVEHPHVIHIDGKYYVIDGHHKIVRAHNDGLTSILCKIFDTQDIRLRDILRRRDQGPVIKQEVM